MGHERSIGHPQQPGDVLGGVDTILPRFERLRRKKDHFTTVASACVTPKIAVELDDPDVVALVAQLAHGEVDAVQDISSNK